MASAQFEIDPGTAVYATPPQNAAVSATVNCRLLSVSGVQTIAWRIFGTHGVANPTITRSGNPVGQIASFDMLATPGQAYGIECLVNNGVEANPISGGTFTAAVFVLDSSGRQLFVQGEVFEADPTYGTIPRLNSEGLIPAFVSTVAGGATIEIVDYTMADETALHVEATLIAHDTTAEEFAAYQFAALYERHGGGAAVLVGSGDLATPIEDDAAWGLAAGVAANAAQMTFTGDAANTVELAATFRVRLMPLT